MVLRSLLATEQATSGEGSAASDVGGADMVDSDGARPGPVPADSAGCAPACSVQAGQPGTPVEGWWYRVPEGANAQAAASTSGHAQPADGLTFLGVRRARRPPPARARARRACRPSDAVLGRSTWPQALLPA